MGRIGSNAGHQVAVALRLADARLQSRIADGISAASDLALTDRFPADVVVVDTADFGGTEGSSVLLIGEQDGPLPPIVRGVLPEGATPAMIVEAVHLVAHGLLVLPDSVLDRVSWVVAEEAEDESRPPRLNGAAADHDHPAAPVVLTEREHQVLQLLAAGASNKLIARKLDISVHTAKFHVASLLRKLGASGRAEAIGIGLRSGLLMV